MTCTNVRTQDPTTKSSLQDGAVLGSLEGFKQCRMRKVIFFVDNLIDMDN